MEEGIHISLKPETLFAVFNFPVTNSFLATVGLSIAIMAIFLYVGARMKAVPGRLQLFIEIFVTGSRDFVHSVTGNEAVTRRIFPLFATMAILYLVSNLFGFIPGLAALSYDGVALWRPPTADYALIFVITITMFLLWQFAAIVTGGLVAYGKKFFNFSSPLNFVLGLLDIIGEIAKIVSLSFRLFGNIFAGEVIGAVILGLVPFFAPIPFMFLGLLSSVIQAFVFPILVLIFMNMAIVVKEEKEKEATREGELTKATT
jgi:F-type H+-transporting ATPase subunit a